MSNFICKKCGAAIYDTDFGYISGCEHYPIEDLGKVCAHCFYNWDGHCIKGYDRARLNPKSIIHIVGCTEFEDKRIKKSLHS
jgi:ssDNA-binding Zn-finger/Zn-ribbon topoisomerase 1